MSKEKIVKQCSKCKKIKPQGEFYPNGKWGLKACCKSCENIYSKKYYQRNKEKVLFANKTYRQEHRTEAVIYSREYWKNNRKRLIEQLKKRREKRNFDGKRKEILERDNYSCQECGSKQNLVVHHKDGSGRGVSISNNNEDNLVTLCRKCHILLHKKREVQYV